MPPKESIYFTKNQIQMLCELYQEEDNLWNVISPDYHKKDRTIHWKGSKRKWSRNILTYNHLQVKIHIFSFKVALIQYGNQKHANNLFVIGSISSKNL